MSEVRDVIINVFSCSKMAPCGEWAKEFFKEPPLIVVVPAQKFRQKAHQWAKTGDMFRAATKDMLDKDVQVRRRGLVTFSLGWIFADTSFTFRKEIDNLDAYLLLDGCHTRVLDDWAQFAKRAAEGKSFMAMAHSSIVPPFISAEKSNVTIFKEAKNLREEDVPNLEVPEYVSNVKLPTKGIDISLGKAGNLPPVSKHWSKDPLLGYEVVGNLVRLHYDGNDRPDHVYIAWRVSKVLWQWFGERWSLEEFESTDTSEVSDPDPVFPEEDPEPTENTKPDADPTPDPQVEPTPDEPVDEPVSDDPVDEQSEQERTRNVFQVIIAFILLMISKMLGRDVSEKK